MAPPPSTKLASIGLMESLGRRRAGFIAKRGTGAGKNSTVELQVVGVFPHVHQAMLRSPSGLQYTVTRKTPGVQVDTLREGQRLSCVIAPDVPKILEAKVLA